MPRLVNDPALQIAIMGRSGNKEAWNHWVSQRFPDFLAIRELCNGSKHFLSKGSLVTDALQSGWDSPLFSWDDKNSYG